MPSGATSAAILNIADAVVAILNDAALNSQFSQFFIAERFYVPVHKLPELTTLQVTVVPMTIGGELLSRGGQYLETHTISIGVQQQIGQGAMTNDEIKAACDPLVFLCQEIISLFAAKPLTGYSRAMCTWHDWKPVFSPEHLDERRVFTGVVTLTYKVGW
jgi:hypothetical protein